MTPKLPTFTLRTWNWALLDFFDYFHKPEGSQGCIVSKSYITPNFNDRWFPARFVPLGPSGCVGSKSCIKAEATGGRFQGGSFLQKCWNLKNFVAPTASPAFRPQFIRPWAKNQNSAPNILFASLSQFLKGATWPPFPKPPREDGFGRNSGGPGVQISCPKITSEELNRP